MKSRLRQISAGLFLVLVAVGLAVADKTVRFTAAVRAGDVFTRDIGHGLYFAIAQDDGGTWNFKVKPSRSGDISYTDCLASPMLHGPATEDLSAWRFAPGADAGWAESVPVKKPVVFVMNARDNRYECAESEAVYNSFQKAQLKGLTPDGAGLRDYKPRPMGKGEVTIRSVTLVAGKSGSDAAFEEVVMDVVVRFPGRKK